ncbi:MAG TPA: hypothetical protein VNY05_17300 [Candidatus Acidoferrales bacterium]|nr:hypothetical protein [Candidatus Acidoferrales bacterium]
MKRLDPLLRDIDLPLTGTFFPAGFRLNLATNSRDVLEAADECWRHYQPEFECPPMEFRVVVEPHGGPAGLPRPRAQGHIFSMVSDGDNYAVVDSEGWFACFYLSAETAADHARLRWYYLESMAYTLLAHRYVVPIHAACVAHNGAGILLCGASGAGKSTVSFACARAGWTFLSDDCTFLKTDSDDRIAIGQPHRARFRDDSRSVFPELADYAPSTRPGGKLSLEVPLSDFPLIRTASRCPIRALFVLDRRSGVRPRAARLPPGEAVDKLFEDNCTYGAEVDAMHERAIRRLQGLPSWRLHYESFDDAVRLLSEVMLTERIEP